MRLSLFACVTCVALLSAVSQAAAAGGAPNEVILGAGKVTTYAPLNEIGGIVPSVTRGQALTIACSEVRQPGADVRVIMRVTNTAGEMPTGYEAVLATDQQIGRGLVHVRVPDVPNLAQHTVDVTVVVVNRRGTHSCDAGRVRIV